MSNQLSKIFNELEDTLDDLVDRTQEQEEIIDSLGSKVEYLENVLEGHNKEIDSLTIRIVTLEQEIEVVKSTYEKTYPENNRILNK